jgi:DNA transformation protein
VSGEAFAEYIRDLFAGIPRLAVRRMFGGQGIFAADLMFAISIDDVIYIKTDAAMKEELAALGSSPFVYALRKTPGERETGYWRLPESALDDPDEASAWGKRALAVAKTKKKPAKKKTLITRR